MDIISFFQKKSSIVIKQIRKLPFVFKIILVLIILFFGWFGFTKLNKQKNQPYFQTAEVEKGTIISTVSASGTILSTNIINVNTQASGIIKAVYVKQGEYVTTGQKIAEIILDQESQQKNATNWTNYLSAKNNLESANTTLYSLQADMFSYWDAFKKLAESSQYQNNDGSPRYDQRALPEFHIAEKKWLAAEAKYKNQQAVIEQAKSSLNSAWLSYQLTSPIVTAPTNGFIISLAVVPGMVINSQTNSSSKIATIQNQEAKPIISVNIPEIDISKIKIDQKATIEFDSLPEKTFTGKVVAIDKIGITSNNVINYPTFLELDTTSQDILPNMAASAKIIIESKTDVLLVPSTAVKVQDNQTYVQVLKNGQIQQINIQTGISGDTQTEVISGLSEGDKVIIGSFTSQTQQGRTSIFGTNRLGGGNVFRLR